MNGSRGRSVRLIVAGLAALTVLAGASGTANSSTALIVNGGGYTVPVLATGTAPVTSGSVTAEVTPNMAVGATATPTVVASAPINSAGGFTLQADPGAGPMASIVSNAIQNNNGWVNFDLIEVGADGKMTVQSVSRQFTSSSPSGGPVAESSITSDGGNPSSVGGWAGDGSISDSSSVQPGSTTVDASTYVVLRGQSTAAASAAATQTSDDLALSQQLATGTATTTAAATSPDAGFVPNPCAPITTLQDQQNQDTVIGELHTADNESATFTYGKTADTSADVGIELAGTGVYNVSGSVHIGNGSSTGNAITIPAGTQFGYKIESGFLHQHYYTTYLEPSLCGASPYYSVKTDDWTGEPNPKILGTNVHNLDNQCTTTYKPYAGNWVGTGHWDRSSGAFTHFSNAFNIFGFSGGTRSGASSYVHDHYVFTGTSTTGHWLCGNDAYIFSQPHRIFTGF